MKLLVLTLTVSFLAGCSSSGIPLSPPKKHVPQESISPVEEEKTVE